MSAIRTGLSLVVLLIMSNLSFAQAISKDYQKNCTREQVAEHQGMKGKVLAEEDFVAYCDCLADYISKNSSNLIVSLNSIGALPRSTLFSM
jgi:hypothetical protein